MLFTSLLLVAVGFTLVYAGLHSGETWKHPWSPWVEQLHKPATPAS